MQSRRPTRSQGEAKNQTIPSGEHHLNSSEMRYWIFRIAAVFLLGMIMSKAHAQRPAARDSLQCQDAGTTKRLKPSYFYRIRFFPKANQSDAACQTLR
jgi:hypothetical protein